MVVLGFRGDEARIAGGERGGKKRKKEKRKKRKKRKEREGKGKKKGKLRTGYVTRVTVEGFFRRR
jgi:hypothetical protein